MAEDTLTGDALQAEADEAVEIENPTVVSPETVWLRHRGVAHNVNVGSEAHRRLLEHNARPIDGPTAKEQEVTDFGMLEKAKADKRSR